MVELIAKNKKEEHFRWHDSGDLQSVRHLQRIVRIAERLPEVSFWLPTKEYGIVLEYLNINPDGFPKNLTVRLSSLLRDVPFEDQCSEENLGKIQNERLVEDMLNIRNEGLPTSAVLKDVEQLRKHFICTAPETEGKCEDCRACWDKKVKNIGYHYH